MHAAARRELGGEKEGLDAVAVYLMDGLCVVSEFEYVEDGDGFCESEPGREECMVVGLLGGARVKDER